MQSATAFAHVFAGCYQKAVAHAETALSENPVLHMGLRVAALACALAGHTTLARGFVARLRDIDHQVAYVEVPLSYMNEFYHLRLHLGMMQENLKKLRAQLAGNEREIGQLPLAASASGASGR